MIKKIIFIHLLLITVFLKITAQEKQSMNLEQMLEFAKQNNYQINEAILQKQKSDAKINEVRGMGLPQIKSEVDYKNYLELPKTIVPASMLGSDEDMEFSFGKAHNMDISAQFSQLLFSLKYINGLKTAKKASEISSLQVEKAHIEMVHLLITEYYNLMAIYKNLEIIESNMESLDQMKSKIRALVSGGVALKTDLDKISINYTNLKANKDQIVSAINVQTNNLKYIIGLDASVELTVDTTNFYKIFQDVNLSECITEDVSFNDLNDIKLLNNVIELNNLQIKTQQAAKYPNVALYGSYVYQGIRDEFNFFDKNQNWFNVQLIGIKATIPIFTGLSNNAKIKSAKYEMQITQNQKQKALSGLQLQYSNAIMQYNSSVRNCLIQRDNIDLAKEVRHQEEVKYNQGISTLTDLLISESDLRNAEINYAQNFITMKQAEIDLLKSKGQLLNYQITNSYKTK